MYLYEPVLILKSPNEKPITYIIKKFKSLENDFVDVAILNDYYKSFENKYDAYKNLFFIGDIHFNKKGNLYVAQEILSKLKF